MKTFGYLSLFFVFCFVNNVSAAIYWDKTFGGTETDYGSSVQQTTDGGFIITGGTSSYGVGGGDIWLIKTDAIGVKQWDRTFGGTKNDHGQSVKQTTDGGYIITGGTSSYGAGDRDVWLIKTDAFGVKQWDQTFGGTGDDCGSSVQQTTDEGYIITGSTSSYGAGETDVWLIKTDAFGVKQWDQTFGGMEIDGGGSVQQTTDGGYIIIGETSYYKADVWLIKTDAFGVKQWDQIFGGPEIDCCSSGQQTIDGGYIITGFTKSYGAGSKNVWLIKTDAFGVKQWDRTFSGKEFDSGSSVQQTSDEGYIITGKTGPFNSDVWLIKTDASGIKQWDQIFSGPEVDYGSSVQQTTDGGYIITGCTNYPLFGYGGDLWLIYYKRGLSPYPPTLISPLDGSTVNAPLVELKWINNGSPENDPVGSWLYMVGPLGQVISYDMGAEGFIVGEELSFSITLFPGQEWAWTVYIYDPNYNSEPYYSFQEPFWTFFVSD